ncbi:MAG: hypothetical protein ACLGH8_07655 [Bacteroidia bacterium]
MNLTSNQYKYAVDLLNQIGYIDDKLINEVLELYTAKYCRVIKNTYNGKTTKRYSYDMMYDILKKEINIKKEFNHLKRLEINYSSYNSATDLSSFYFCIASFSISKSYLIEHNLNQSLLSIGETIHEKLRLLKKTSIIKRDFSTISLSNSQKDFLEKINLCELVYSGHSINSKIFYNNKKKYLGKPDYIFKDRNGRYFIVEEKFRLRGNHSNSENITYQSDIIQIQSYMDYIINFDISYGILINWHYSTSDGLLIGDNKNIFINNFNYKIIYKNTYSHLLERKNYEVHSFKQNGVVSFPNVNSTKCLNCSVSFYCFHKTNRFNTVNLPYNPFFQTY